MNGFDKSFESDMAIFKILFFTLFFIVLGFIIFYIARNILIWHRNNNSPRLTVDADVVTKRMSVTNRRHNELTHEHGYYTTSSTTYYVTFQVESGDRMELSVSGQEYGMLAEGDRGKLTFQGTRYLSFERGM